MRFTKVIFIISFLVIFGSKSFSSDLEGLIELNSKEQNELSSSPVNLIHLGVLVALKSNGQNSTDRYFILTTAHGLNSSIKAVIHGVSILPSKWIKNSDWDAGVIEISSKDVHRLNLDDVFADVTLDQKKGFLVRNRWGSVLLNNSSIPGFSAFVPYLGKVQQRICSNNGLSLLPRDFVEMSRRSTSPFIYTGSITGVFQDPVSKIWIGSNQIKNGMSGAPLVTAFGDLEMQGIATSFELDFDYSYYAPIQEFRILIQQLLDHISGEVGKSTFVYRNGYYKIFPDGTTDIIKDSTNSDNLKLTTSTVVGGSNPSLAGGEGSDGGGIFCKDRKGENSSSYKLMNISPGITWQNKPSIALKVGSNYYYGSRSSIEWLRNSRNYSKVAIDAIAPGSPLTPLLKQKIRMFFNDDMIPTNKLNSFQYPITGTCELHPASLSILNDGKVELKFQFCGRDSENVQLVLDETGRVLDESGKPLTSKFHPIVHHKNYTIDIRPLYFQDVDWRAEGNSGISEPPYIRVKREPGTVEYFIGFERVPLGL